MDNAFRTVPMVNLQTLRLKPVRLALSLAARARTLMLPAQAVLEASTSMEVPVSSVHWLIAMTASLQTSAVTLGVLLLISGLKQEAVRPVRSTVVHVTQPRTAWTAAVVSSWMVLIVSPIVQVGSGRTNKPGLARPANRLVENARAQQRNAPAAQWASF